jgi:predicted AAA+ superfamily ATPase
MDEVYLARDIESDLAEWKNRRDNGLKKNLIIGGCRQTGKTTTLSKFVEDNYKVAVNIDFSIDEHRRRFNEWNADLVRLKSVDAYTDLFLRYDPDFTDSPDTVIFVDEVQFSHAFYNYIRDITHKMKCHVIATGSYLRRLYDNPEVVRIASEVKEIEMNSISFEEFLGFFGHRNLYYTIDIYGNSPDSDYTLLSDMFEAYLKCGGYPAVVSSYYNLSNFSDWHENMEMVFSVFLEESSMFFPNIQDRINLRYDVMNLARLILNNKNSASPVKPLAEILSNPAKNTSTSSSKSSNDSIKGIISWFSGSNIMGGCGLVRNCDINNRLLITKYYFRDVGFAYWLLGRVSTESGNLIGSIAENFIYLVLLSLLNPFKSNLNLSPEIPAYATYAKGEIDFFLINRTTDSKFAIEVKYSGGETKTPTAALTDGKVDFIVKAQGKGPFGISGKVHIIPIYLLGRFDFSIPKPAALKKSFRSLFKLN